MSAPFGRIAGGPTPRRTGQRVRRDSYHRGEREHLIWRPLGETKRDARRFKGALVRAAKNLERSSKLPGRRMGDLGLTGVRVLEVLTEIVDDVSGRLEPMIATIAEKAGLAARTVVRALARLKDAGFIDWLRRTVPLENDGAGPQVEQTSNAYWFALRGRAEGLVRLIMGKAPPDTPSRNDVAAAAARQRTDRLRSMNAPRPHLAAADVISDEVKESLRKLQALRARGASDLKAQNPGGEG